ncbi:MAG: hypothetical protein M0T74_11180 [Desulfitobacterium hafniense]|nr:hypothetical protein [Desulfitobacterium hafniense]
MDKSKKLVSLFLSSALVIGIAGCNDQPRYKTVYDQNGNPVQVIEEDDDDYNGGFFYWVSSPFRSRSYIPSTGVTSGTSGGVVRPGTTTPSTGTNPESPQTGVVGRSPWASGSSSSGSSSSTSGTSSGITSGAKGGIGSSGSSVS